MTRQKAASLVFSVLLVSSMVAGVAFIGTQPLSESQTGTAAAQSGTSERVYAGDGSGNITGYDSSDGSELWTYDGTSTSGSRLVESPNGSSLYAALDTTVVSLDPSDGTTQWSASSVHSGDIQDIDVGPNGDWLYTVALDNTVKRLHASNGTVDWTFSGHSASVYSVAVGENGDVVYSGDGNGVLKAINADTGGESWSTSAFGSAVFDLDASPSENTVYGGSSGDTVRALNETDGSERWSYTGHTNSIDEVVVSPDGNWIYTGSHDTELHRLSTAGNRDWAYTAHSTTVRGVGVSEDGATVYSAAESGSLDAIDADTKSEQWSTSETGFWSVAGAGDSYSDSNTGSDVSGKVEDQNGQPQANTTVIAAAVNASAEDLPDVDRSQQELEDMLRNPEPPSWKEQLDALNDFSKDQFSPDPDDFSGQRVFLHTEEDWSPRPIPDRYVVSDRLWEGQPPDDVTPRPAIDADQEAYFACWEPDASIYEDDIDNSIPGFQTVEGGCDVTVERIDPEGGELTTETYESQAFMEVDPPWIVGGKTHHVATAELEPGFYRVYPEGSPDAAMTYAVAPNGDVDNVEPNIEAALEGDCSNISGYGAEYASDLCDLTQKGAFEAQKTTTNQNGEFSFTFNQSVSHVELRAVRSGTGLEDTESAEEFRHQVASEFESAVKSNFRERAPTRWSPDDYTAEEFREYCSEMPSVIDDVGSPFYGEARTDVPNQDVTIRGHRAAIPEEISQEVRRCGAWNLAEQFLNDPLSMLPGFTGDLAEYGRAELEALYEQLYQLIQPNDELRNAIESELDGDLSSNPDDYTDDELRNTIEDGFGTIDSPPSDGGYGSGGGSWVPGGDGDGPRVDDPIDDVSDRVNETISRTWPVAGVDSWQDAGLLIRIVFSDGTEDVLGPDSEYLRIEERAVGPDRVHLEEYPFQSSDASVARVTIDVTTSGGHDRDRGHARNPTYDGDVPGLRTVRVSTTAPGPSDTVEISALPEQETAWGGVQWVNVTGPDCTSSNQATDDAASVEMCGAGQHRIQIQFTNQDGDPFREVVHIDARTASQARPAAIRAAAGPTGRYSIVGNGITDGRLEVSDGTSVVTLVGIVPGDQDVPNRVTASTTGVDVARDATTTVKIRQGETEQTVRQRLGIVMHVDQVGNESLLYRNNRPIRNPGESSDAVVEHRNDSTMIDSFTSQTAEVSVEVSRDPGWFERAWHAIRLQFPSLAMSLAWSGNGVLIGAGALVAVRRRRRRGPAAGQEAET